MTAPRPAILASLLLVGAASLRAASPVEADPHELFERASERLSTGDLKGCATAISRLKDLIAHRPEWDPEGTFSDDLLPPLLSTLGRLEGAAGRLDEFSGRALRDVQPPEPGPDMDTVGDYTKWATSVIGRLRSERDDIVKAALNDPEERAILTRTESYARTEHLLEVEVLSKVAEASGEDILGLVTGDPDLESVLVRFRQIKRELIEAAAERDQLRKRMRESGAHCQALLDTLSAVLTDDASAKERDALRSSLDSYARHNQALQSTGLGSDQSGSIRALAQAVEGIPARQEPVATPPSKGPLPALILIVVASGAGVLAWLALARRRRLASPRRPVPRPLRGVEVPPGGADADRDAA